MFQYLVGIAMFVLLACVIALFMGWCLNIYHLTQCDFEAPYKCEVIRGVGVLIPFVGIVAGWVDIDDGPG